MTLLPGSRLLTIMLPIPEPRLKFSCRRPRPPKQLGFGPLVLLVVSCGACATASPRIPESSHQSVSAPPRSAISARTVGVGCLANIVVTPSSAASVVSESQAEAVARSEAAADHESSPTVIGSVMGLSSVSHVTVDSSQVAQRDGWLFVFDLTRPSGQESAPPVLRWRYYSLVDATNGRPLTACGGAEL